MMTTMNNNVLQQPQPPQNNYLNGFNIDYILFSEFDIDKGAVVRVQYPKIFPHSSEAELSAQMLPDGSHNCTEDATVFLIRPYGSSAGGGVQSPSSPMTSSPSSVSTPNDDTSTITFQNTNNNNNNELKLPSPSAPSQQQQQEIQSSSSESSSEMASSTPSVNTIVPRLTLGSIATGHSNQNAEDNFGSETATTATATTTTGIVTSPADTDNNNNKFAMNQMSSSTDSDLFYGFNIYKQKKYENIRRGTRVKSIAVLSRNKTCYALKPLLSEILDIIFQIFDHEKHSGVGGLGGSEHASDQKVYDQITLQLHAFLEHAYNHINSINLTHIPNYSETQRLVWRFCVRKSLPLYETVETTFEYRNHEGFSSPAKKIPLRIPVFLFENELSILYEKKEKQNVSDFVLVSTPRKKTGSIHVRSGSENGPFTPRGGSGKHHHHSHHHSHHYAHLEESRKRREKYDGTKASLVNLINVFGEKTMMIFNAILYGKSVMFIANNKNAGYVMPYVLASLSLHPQLPNVLHDRVFPYVSFMNMDWVNEKDNGFIVGVTNPIFTSREEYFDFLCDVDTGKITVSTCEKNRLQQKQHLSTHSGKKRHTKLRSSKKNKRKHSYSSSGEDFPAFNMDDFSQSPPSDLSLEPQLPPSTPRRIGHQRAISEEEVTATAAEIIDESSVGAGMGLISDAVTGALSSNSSSGIVQSMTVKVSENDDVCHMTSKDTEFIRKIMYLISQNQKKRVPREETEEVVRGHFFDYSTSVLELAFDMRQRILYQKKQYYRSVSSSYEKKISEEEEPDENVLKTFTWRQTYSFRLYSEKRVERSKSRLIIQTDADISQLIHTLVHGSELDEEQIISIFQRFLRHIHTREELLEFVSYLPESKGGINPITYPIFHSSPAVRVVVAAFMRRLEKEGLLLHLNPFLMVNYIRNAKVLSDNM